MGGNRCLRSPHDTGSSSFGGRPLHHVAPVVGIPTCPPPPPPLGACRHWILPASPALRPYQLHMAHCALLRNTLVALPTGLGKTLVAAVVMFNFYRWGAGWGGGGRWIHGRECGLLVSWWWVGLVVPAP